jgi:hypothetical protein
LAVQLGADPLLAAAAELLWNRVGVAPVPALPSSEATSIVSAAMMLHRPLRRLGHFDVAESLRELIEAFGASRAQWVHAWCNVLRFSGPRRSFDASIAIYVATHAPWCMQELWGSV